MSGLKRSPGLADINVCHGAYGAGYGGFTTAIKRSSRTYEDGTPAPKAKTVDRRSFTDPLAHVAPSMLGGMFEDEEASPEAEVHAGFENRILFPPVHAKELDLNESGLPPTPPTLTNSDIAVAQQLEPAQPVSPVFADGVRNALHSQKSGLSATPVNQLSPPTPDPSPPAVPVDAPPMKQKEKAHFLHPILTTNGESHALKQAPSSRAESFRTALEDPTKSPDSMGMGQVHLPEDDTLPEHWLDSTRALDSAQIGIGHFVAAETPKEEKMNGSSKDALKSRRRSKHESPPGTAHGESDWEKHISYVSGPDELDALDSYVTSGEADTQRTAGLGVSGAGLHQSEMERSAEDVNNMVYKRIQEENVKRHSNISATSGAITVGVILPAAEATKTLKRQTKCRSLRDDASITSKRDSGDSERKLSHKKVRLPDRVKGLESSPVFESSIRQVSSPARLGPDASNMTALTYASMRDPDWNAKVGTAHMTREQVREVGRALRHVSYQDRLSRNMSVQRTSQEASPPHARASKTFEIVREPDYVPNRRSVSERVTNNMAAKRSSTDGARSMSTSERQANPLRGVIPSVSTDGEERSPTSKLRRFSREERLENNDQVRRTSLGHADQLLQQSESSPGRPQIEKLPSSPRKSLDARFLHPSNTPMSTSQFSDRTENIELCEASGVKIYPHNNNSLLVVQHGSRPVSNDKDIPDLTEEHLGTPIFAAQVDPPTPILGTSKMVNHVDSPLTNPRQAPEPPVIKFIPPTPNQELDDQIGGGGEGTLRAEANFPQRRLSLVQKARRYSDSLLARAGSLRKPRAPQRSETEPRETHLSPLWRPQGFWDDFDSEDEDDFEPAGTLPRGGDTSNIEEREDGLQKSFLPRAMSKRLPGFRGTGGFLLGNSLGLDRHGTNNRRHYVSTGSRTLSERASQEVLKNLSSDPHASSRSQESFMKIARVRRSTGSGFTVPFSGGKRAQWVGAQRFRNRMRRIRAQKEEKELEKRRQNLRKQIGYRVYHDT